MSTDAPDTLLTDQAAFYCRLKHENFKRYVRRGRVKPLVPGARCLHFSKEELDRFIREDLRKGE